MTNCDELQETRFRLKRKLDKLKANAKEDKFVKNDSHPTTTENIDSIIKFIEGNQTDKGTKKKKKSRNKSKKKHTSNKEITPRIDNCNSDGDSDDEIDAFRMALLNVTPADEKVTIPIKTKEDIKKMCLYNYMNKHNNNDSI